MMIKRSFGPSLTIMCKLKMVGVFCSSAFFLFGCCVPFNQVQALSIFTLISQSRQLNMASFWLAVTQSALAWKGPTSLLRSGTFFSSFSLCTAQQLHQNEMIHCINYFCPSLTNYSPFYVLFFCVSYFPGEQIA